MRFIRGGAFLVGFPNPANDIARPMTIFGNPAWQLTGFFEIRRLVSQPRRCQSSR
jgi:hypothetical protein